MASGALLVIPIVLLVIGGLGLLMFWDAAFSGGRARVPESHLPLLSGSSLYEWGVIEGRRLTERWMKAHQGTIVGARLAAEAKNVADGVVGRAWCLRLKPAAIAACRPLPSGAPRVTVPEALGIVEELRSHDAGEQREIVEQARENIALRHRIGPVVTSCPLLQTTGMCACTMARPLACSGRCRAGFDTPPGGEAWARTLGEGIETGLEAALRERNLDAGRYDLNEALVTLFANADASDRWSRGERVMAEKDAELS